MYKFNAILRRPFLTNSITASHGKRSGGEETAVAIGSNYRNAMEII